MRGGDSSRSCEGRALLQGAYLLATIGVSGIGVSGILALPLFSTRMSRVMCPSELSGPKPRGAGALFIAICSAFASCLSVCICESGPSDVKPAATCFARFRGDGVGIEDVDEDEPEDVVDEDDDMDEDLIFPAFVRI